MKNYFSNLKLIGAKEIEGGLERVLNWSTQLLCGLDFLHNKLFENANIAHRDIKPA